MDDNVHGFFFSQQKIVLQSIELQIAPETTERFFGASDAPSDPSQPYSDSLRPSCETRVEVIPRYARARNVFGTWVYLVEAADHLRQNVKVIFIQKACHGFRLTKRDDNF